MDFLCTQERFCVLQTRIIRVFPYIKRTLIYSHMRTLIKGPSYVLCLDNYYPGAYPSPAHISKNKSL